MVKAPKDPNAPKKPLTPYFAFKDKHYNRIVKTMTTGYNLGELSKKISAEWAKTSESDKQALTDKYQEGMKKFNKLFNAYKLTGNYQKHQLRIREFKTDAQKKKEKFRKDENAPKRPQTAYFGFMADKREVVKSNNPEKPHKELVKMMAEMWTKLTDAEKKPYETEAKKKKEAYEKDLAAYKQSDEFKQYQKEKLEHKQSLKTAKKAKSPKVKKAKAAKASKKEKKAKSPKAKKAKKVKKKSKSPKKKAAKGGKKPKAPKKSAGKKSQRKSGKSQRKSGKKARKATKAKK